MEAPALSFPPCSSLPLLPLTIHTRGACVIRDAALSSVASGQNWKTMVMPDNQVKDPAIAVGLRA